MHWRWVNVTDLVIHTSYLSKHLSLVDEADCNQCIKHFGSKADIYYDTDDVHKQMPEVHKRPCLYDLQYLVKLCIIFAKHN